MRVPAVNMGQHLIFLLLALLMARTGAKVIDLSHNHGPNTIMSPHAPHFNRSTLFAGDYLPGIYAEAGQYSSGEHGGTHIDAPVHFLKDGQKVHQIPLENTIAEGVMIDCTAEAALNSSYLVPVQKLLDWEKQHGQIPMKAAVLFNFGWSSKFHDELLYLGVPAEDQFNYVFPAVGAEAGFWLYDNRDIKIIGADVLSPDPFTLNRKKITSFPIHQKYLPDNRLIIENLNGLDKLPPKGFRFHAAPVKYVEATGTQIRAYAMTFDEDLRGSTAGLGAGHTCLLLILFLYCTMLF